MDAKAAELPVSDKLWAWFETHKKEVGIGAVAVLVLGGIAGFIAWRNTEKQVAAGEALTSIALTQSAPTAQPSGDAFLKIAGDYPKTEAGERALLQAAGAFFTEGKYDQAKVQFERFTREYGDSPMAVQAAYGVAVCLDAQNKVPEAIAAYETIRTRHPTDAVAPLAKFALGRLYEAQGKIDSARLVYQDVMQTEQNNSLGNEAGQRLEELNWKYPPPAPPPAPPAVSSPTSIPNLPVPSASTTSAPNPPAVPAPRPSANTNVSAPAGTNPVQLKIEPAPPK
jgi:TolA-binding protein